jgi:hypothetical protein
VDHKNQEYDMVIKPTKLIKGQGIEKIMAETNLQVVGINVVEVEGDKRPRNKGGSYIKAFYHQSPWY